MIDPRRLHCAIAWIFWIAPDASLAEPVTPPATSGPWTAPIPGEPPPPDPDSQALEQHEPGRGTNLAGGKWGAVDFSLYLSIRYLNQHALDSTFTDSSGTTMPLDRRDDLQVQKVIVYFKGWLGVPDLRYLTYVWTSNASQGLGAQVVVAGNLSYTFDDAATIVVGIDSLPTTRSTRGSFPRWNRVDSRTIADEYFRGSYTSGVTMRGSIRQALHYKAMLGNNLSQLGVDAGQLDMGLETFSGALWWSTRNLSAFEPLGDVEHHDRLGASIGAAFSISRESAENQPGTEAPENTQLRISDGRRIFIEGVFAPGVAIDRATYSMAAFDAALKYRGFALEGELFYRRLDNFDADAGLPITHLRDHGFQLQASGLVLPRTLMAYVFGSAIFGQYGDPWDLGLGVNYFPFKTRVLRTNVEAILVDDSPVGNLSAPLIVGADGLAVVMNVELLF